MNIRKLLGFVLFVGASASAQGRPYDGNGTTTTLDVLRFAGADLGAKLQTAQLSLNGKSGGFRIGTAGVLTTPVTLAAGNDLVINAPVTMSGLVTLAGRNHVSCTSNGALKVKAGAAFASTASNLQVDHCAASGDGTIDAALLKTKGSSHVRADHNTLLSIGVVNVVGGSDFDVSDNSVAWPGGTPAGYGVVWQGTSDVRVVHNEFVNVANAVEFFNADADPAHGSAGSGRASIVNYAGHYLIANNTCTGSKACYWGSVGHDIVMSGNYAANCSDVCYDVEGSVDVTISGNRGQEAKNGVGAVFFYSDNVTFTGNSFSSATGKPLIRVYNSSLDPKRSSHLTVRSNILDCSRVVCQGVSGDPASDMVIESNTMTNAVIDRSGFAINARFKSNDLTFTVAAHSAINAITGPNLIGGSQADIAGNVIRSVMQPAGSACIAEDSGDFNTSVSILITGNKCLSGFPIDISTTNSGGNPGTTVNTTISGNWLGANKVIHKHTTPSHDSYQLLGSVGPSQN